MQGQEEKQWGKKERRGNGEEGKVEQRKEGKEISVLLQRVRVKT